MTGPRFCPECGTAGPLPLIGICSACLTYEKAQEIANNAHKLALAVLREADRADAIRELKAAAAQAQADLAAVQARTGGLETTLLDAVTAERAAQDRAREAEAFRRRCEEDEHRAQRDKASPEAQTAAIGRLRDAATVAAREKAAAEGAAGIRQQAETVLGAHRNRIRGLEDAAEAARAASDNPPDHVPVSVWTALLAHPTFLLTQPDITDEGRALASLQVKQHAEWCGVADNLLAEGRGKGKEEVRHDMMTKPWLVHSGQPNSLAAVLPPTAPRPGDRR